MIPFAELAAALAQWKAHQGNSQAPRATFTNVATTVGGPAPLRPLARSVAAGAMPTHASPQQGPATTRRPGPSVPPPMPSLAYEEVGSDAIEDSMDGEHTMMAQAYDDSETHTASAYDEDEPGEANFGNESETVAGGAAYPARK